MKRITFLIIALLMSSYYLDAQNQEYGCSKNKVFTKTLNKRANSIMQNYDIKFCKIDLELDDTTTNIKGYVTIKAQVVSNALDTFMAELTDSLTIDSVFVNGSPNLNFTHLKDEVKVCLSSAIPKNNFVDIRFCYHGTSPNGAKTFLGGFSSTKHPQLSPNNSVTWSLSEPFAAKNWFICKQDLTDKIDSAHIFITVNDNLKAGSNGILTRVKKMPNNKKRFEWKTNYMTDYYLYSVAVSKYQEYNTYAKPKGYQDSILIQNYICNSAKYLDKYKANIDSTADAIELYSELFGLYPFHKEKYGHCIVPIWGGMEHQTMTSLGYFKLDLVNHELVHQWFGNNVTCKSWQDIWVNEGFASYGEYLGREFLVSKDHADAWMKKAHKKAVVTATKSIYIPKNEVWDSKRIFSNSLSYKKGAAIIHTLRFEINNDSLFFAVLKNFQNKFKNSTATGADFRDVVNQTTGIDFNYFFDQWYYGKGHPVFDINWHQKGDSLYISSVQSTTHHTNPLFKISTEYKIKYKNGSDTTVRFVHDKNKKNYAVFIPTNVDELIFDPNNWILERHQISSAASQHDFKLKNIRIYPNPAFSYLRVELNYAGNFKLEIIDLLGKKVYKTNASNRNILMNNLDLNSGIYILKITDLDNSIEFKKRFLIK